MMNFKTKYKIKKNKRKIIMISSIILCVILLAFLVIFLSYSRFESNKGYSLVNGKVADFSYDVSLVGYVYDGEKHDVPPSKDDDYIVSDVECTNATGLWNNETWSFTVNNISGKVRCKISFEKIKFTEISTKDLKVGDKIKVSVTGNEGTANNWIVLYEGDNPEIVVNDSLPYKIYATEENYLNYIYNINNECKSYLDSNYFISARSLGYDNQTEKCIDKDSCPYEQPSKNDYNAYIKVGLYKGGFIAGREDCITYCVNKANPFSTTPTRESIYTIRSDSSSYVTDNIMPVLKLRSDIKLIRNEYTKECVVQQ